MYWIVLVIVALIAAFLIMPRGYKEANAKKIIGLILFSIAGAYGGDTALRSLNYELFNFNVLAGLFGGAVLGTLWYPVSSKFLRNL